MGNRTKARGIGFQPVRFEPKKDCNHEHLRENVMKKLTGWKPIPRERTKNLMVLLSRAAISEY
jgi:hypothetical protein